MKSTVIITGGTKGLGREVSLAFGRAGSFVIALYAGDQTAAREWEAAFAEARLAGVAVQQDVGSENATLWSRPEIAEADDLTLVHNACAPFSPQPMHLLTWQDFEKNHRVAVKGAWQCSQPLIRLMLRKKRGAIITVLTSAVAGNPPKGFAAYVTAKHALHGFTLALAAEYAPRGLKIFSVSPGYMETALTGQWDERLRQGIRDGAERITQPAVAAERIVVLARSAGTVGAGENYPL